MGRLKLHGFAAEKFKALRDQHVWQLFCNDKLGEVFGSASDAAMLEVGRCLAVFLGIAR